MILKEKYKNDKKSLRTEIKKIKQIYKNKINSISPNIFKQIKNVILLSLSDNLNFTSFKKGGAKFIITYISILLGLSYVFKYFFDTIKGLLNLDISITKPFIATLLFFIIIISTLSSTALITKNLYDDTHNNILITLPINKKYIYLSKIILNYILELKKSFIIYFSLFLGYALSFKLISLFFVFKVILISLLIPLITILISQILSLLVLFIRYLVSKSFISTILLLIFMFLIITIFTDKALFLLSNGNKDISIVNLLISIHDLFNFKFNYLLKYSIIAKSSFNFIFNVGERNIFSIIKIIDVLLILILSSFILSLFFYKFQNIVFKNDNKIFVIKKIGKKPTNIFINYIYKEIKEIIRNPHIIFSLFAYLCILPILFYFLNSFFSYIHLSETGNMIVVLSQIFIGILILSSSNFIAATIISSEGNKFYLLKTNPRDVRLYIFQKMLISIISLFVLLIFSLFLNLKTNLFSYINNIIYMHIVFLLSSLIHIIWVCEEDVVSPYFDSDLKNDNKNITKSIFLGIIISFIITLISYKFINKLYILIMILFLFLLYRILLLSFKINAYIRWEQ